MIVAVIALSVIATVSLIALVWVSIVASRFGKLLLDVEQTTEQILDVIDLRYNAICTISQHNLMSHDPYVRQLVTHVEGLKTDILVIANKLVDAGTRKERKP